MKKTPSYHRLLAEYVDQSGLTERTDPSVLNGLETEFKQGIFRTALTRLLPNGQWAVYMIYGKGGARPVFWQREVGRFRNFRLADIVARYHRKVSGSASALELSERAKSQFGHTNDDDQPVYFAN